MSNSTKGSYIIRAYHQTPNSQERKLVHHNARNAREALAKMDSMARGNDRTLYRMELMVILEEWWKVGHEFTQS